MSSATTAPRNQDPRGISVIGLGKLGLCLALVLADSGFQVVGVDTDEVRVRKIANGRSPIYEPKVESLLRSTHGSLSVTTDHRRAIEKTAATFVVVPTPSKKSGGFSLKHVKVAMRQIGRALAKKRGYHLVVLSSTVMPGSMEGPVRETLEKASGKKAGKDFGLCYNPEFIALGDVVRGLRNPDFVLIGESDPAGGELLSRIQYRVCTNSAPIERMSFWNAELAKMAVNSFVTMKMSFANTLAEICERMPGGEVDKITRAIGRDRRIGAAYLRGGMGYGGPCFPRDNMALARFAKGVGVRADLAVATDRTNRRQAARVIKLVEERFTARASRIGVFGITYKPDTDVVEASQSLMIAQGLAERGFDVRVYDPAISGLSGKRHLAGVNVEEELETCLENSDVCVIATPWKRFADLPKAKLSKKIVIDCWRLLNGNKPEDPSNYLAIGKEMSRRHLAQA